MARLFKPLLHLALALLAALPLSHSLAQQPKTLRWVFSAAATGFDPAGIHDYYSGTLLEAIFEPLLTYDYLARPAKLVPLTAAALPEVSADGLTWTVRIKPGIHFAPDPVFAADKRELTAADYVYAWKRLVDPQVHSPYAFLAAHKFVGLDAVVEDAQRTGRFDYDREVAGLRTLDRYTLQFRLSEPDHNFGYVLAFAQTSALAREVVEKYGDASKRVMAHPVGTGPFRLKQWQRGTRIVLEANPNYHGMIWNFQDDGSAEQRRIVSEMRGKRLPQLQQIDIRIMEEDQSRWLAFQNDEVDITNMDGPLAPRALDGERLKPELAARGVRLSRMVDPEVVYHYWQWTDPVVGGPGKAQIALRRALAMAYDNAEEIRVVRNGQAVALDYPIPPGVAGHNPDWKSSVHKDIATANALLDRYGYQKGADGWRRLPDGQPLAIRYASRPDSTGRLQEETWKKAFDALGIRMISYKAPFPDLIKQEKQCQLQMRSAGWIADYPDGDNFMQLLYGARTGQSNAACFQLPAYDRLYEQARRLPAGPERDRLYHQMTRLIEYYAPWRLGLARVRNMLLQPRVRGYQKHPVLHAEWLYMDIDTTHSGGVK